MQHDGCNYELRITNYVRAIRNFPDNQSHKENKIMFTQSTQTAQPSTLLPIPPHFDPSRADKVWPVDYLAIERNAEEWAARYGVEPAASDRVRVALLVIDAQITFCIPGYELYVGGKTGRGAVDDNVRLCQFIYRNMSSITRIFPTMDTHTQFQIFHPLFWVNDAGRHPDPYTIISHDDIVRGIWKVNPRATYSLGGNYLALQRHVEHYTQQLEISNKYALCVWPPHAMLGGIGHALAPVVHEAVEFHNACRSSQTGFEIKGGHPLTENYSVLAPEVLTTTGAAPLPNAGRNYKFLEKLIELDHGIRRDRHHGPGALALRGLDDRRPSTRHPLKGPGSRTQSTHHTRLLLAGGHARLRLHPGRRGRPSAV